MYGKMKKLLDKLLANKKLSIIIPIAIALLMYLLFVLFGVAEGKTYLMIVTPIVSLVCFFGVFLVLFVLVKNPICPEWFLNLFELLVTIIFGIYAIVGVLSFVVSGFQNFNSGICIDLVAYSAISWAHSKRTK